MNTQAPIKGKLPILAVAVALLLVGAVMAYTYSGTKTSGATRLSANGSSTTATGIEWTYFSSTISQEGLQLEVALNTTSLLAGKGVSAQVNLTNTLPTDVSLSANLTADSALAALSRNELCGGAGLVGMLNFALYQRHYTTANFSQEAVPLILEAPVASVASNCAGYYAQSYTQNVEIAPNSDMSILSANASFAGMFKPQTMEMHLSPGTGHCTTVPFVTGPGSSVVNGSTTTTSSATVLGWGCGPRATLNGYWTMPPNGYIAIGSSLNSTVLQALNDAYHYYHEFIPGSYTIVAEDHWNQTAFGYFEVVS
jgi:hypothetical protein